MTCNCKVCSDHKRWRETLVIDTPEKEKAFNDILSQLEAAQTDAAHAEAILNGTWPQAKEILEATLASIKEKE